MMPVWVSFAFLNEVLSITAQESVEIGCVSSYDEAFLNEVLSITAQE